MRRAASQPLVRTLFQIEFCLLVCRMRGTFYAHAPQLDIWDHGATAEDAVRGATAAIIGMLEMVDEAGRLPAYLESRGFLKEGSVYRGDKALRKEKARELEKDLQWDDDDPDKERKQHLWVKLLKQELVFDFAQPVPAVMWEPRYEEAPRAAARY